MTESLDLRRAVREANATFRCFPVRLSLPLVVIGIISYTTFAVLKPDEHLKSGEHLYFLVSFFLLTGFVTFWLSSFAEVVVARMSLRAREGAEPTEEQFNEVLHYRGFTALIWGVIVRYVGWFLLLFLLLLVLLAVIGVFALLLPGLHGGAGSSSGISEVAGGLGTSSGVFGVTAVGIVAALVLSRYVFVFPMFAIARDAGPAFLDECIRRTRQVWKTAALVLLAAIVPTAVVSSIDSLAWRHLSFPHAVHMATDLAESLLLACYTAWLILVKTGLAVQLTSAQPVLSLEPPPEPLGNGLSPA